MLEEIKEHYIMYSMMFTSTSETWTLTIREGNTEQTREKKIVKYGKIWSRCGGWKGNNEVQHIYREPVVLNEIKNYKNRVCRTHRIDDRRKGVKKNIPG